MLLSSSSTTSATRSDRRAVPVKVEVPLLLKTWTRGEHTAPLEILTEQNFAAWAMFRLRFLSVVAEDAEGCGYTAHGLYILGTMSLPLPLHLRQKDLSAALFLHSSQMRDLQLPQSLKPDDESTQASSTLFHVLPQGGSKVLSQRSSTREYKAIAAS